VTLRPGAAFVIHRGLFCPHPQRTDRRDGAGRIPPVAPDGSFANWRLSNGPFDNLGGIGGAMDLVAGAKEIWLAMQHTTRDGQPRLLEKCTLPVTSPRNVTRVFTDVAVIAVQDGRFVLEEYAPGSAAEEIAQLTGAPLSVSPDLREIDLRL
jgi:3-oxoacid CoA-transferase B subunit